MSTGTICSKAKHVAPKIDEYYDFPSPECPFFVRDQEPTIHSPLILKAVLIITVIVVPFLPSYL